MASTKTTSTPKTAEKTPKESPSPLGENTKLTLIVPKEVAQKGYDQALKRAQQSVKTDGFRKGKAPLSIVEKMVDAEKLINIALEPILPELYKNLIEKENKHPLTQPEISIISADKDADWELEVQIAEKPNFTLGDYKKTIVKALKEAEKELAKQPTATEHDHSHEDHDHGDHDHEGHDHSHADHDHAHEPKNLTAEQKDEKKLQAIFKALLDENLIVIPQLLIKEDVRRQLDGLIRQLKSIKMELEDYLGYQKLTFEQFSGQLAMQSLANYQIEFILDAIKDAEKIEASEADMKEYLKKNDSKSTFEDLDEHTKDHLKHSTSRKKLMDWLLNTTA